MINVYITSKGGEGFVSIIKFDTLEDVVLYTANLGSNCKITISEVV